MKTIATLAIMLIVAIVVVVYQNHQIQGIKAQNKTLQQQLESTHARLEFCVAASARAEEHNCEMVEKYSPSSSVERTTTKPTGQGAERFKRFLRIMLEAQKEIELPSSQLGGGSTQYRPTGVSHSTTGGGSPQ